MRSLTALFGMVLVCGTAFAGTATYLGTHDNTFIQIDGTLLDEPGAASGPANVEYTGSQIVISPLDTAGGTFLQLPDNSNAAIVSTGAGSITAVFTALSLGGGGPGSTYAGIYYEEAGPAGDNQVVCTVTISGQPGLFIVGIISPDAVQGMSGSTEADMPLTLVLTRTAGAISATANGINVGSVSIPDGTAPLFPRIFIDPNPNLGTTFSVSSIEATGVGIPDVNQGPAGPASPTVEITLDGAVDEPFISGTASWTVTFSEDVVNVTDDDFSLTTSGDAVSDPHFVTGGPAIYTVTAANVMGTVGTLRLVFYDGTDVASAANGTAVAGTGSESYSIGSAPVPAAGPFALLLGILALLLSGAAFTYGRTKWINT